ncbi:MAG: hybrid sensor histidine kinase/response regulator, partial [Deltaproteobacteria bacterium]
ELGGAAFCLRLPLVAPAGSVLSAPEAVCPENLHDYANGVVGPQKPWSPRPVVAALPTVLVVEDNPQIRRFICDNLADLYNVVAVNDGAQALAVLAERPVDLVLSDLMMPRLSGAELLQQMRQAPGLRQVPFVMLTAHANHKDHVTMLEGGAQDYLAKPFSTLELRARIGNLISMKRARDILQDELHSREASVEDLASQVQARRHELEAAIKAALTAQHAAEQLSRAKTDFINMISHELRTPLTAMSLQLMRLQRHHNQFSEAQRGALAQLHGSSQRLAGLIESLLQHNKAQSGRLTLQQHTFVVHDVVAALVAELAPQAEAQRLEVRLLSEDRGLQLHSDSELLRIILSNLLVNALKFTPPEGLVEVRTRLDGDHLVIDVSDSGPGIAAEDQAAIFEPFVHLEPVMQKHTPGVGLGLTLVKTITQALGGNIALQSAFGQGATFSLRLPHTAHAAASTPQAQGL